MQGRWRTRIGTTAALVGIAGALSLAPGAGAATREPLTLAYQALHGGSGSPSTASDQPGPTAREASRAFNRSDVSAYEPRITSTYYGQPEIESVRSSLMRLAHGPEMAELTVYLATPAEIAESCGADVLACYLPEVMEMVVSGVDRRVAGVPRAFAIAHEYGHHIANTQRGDLLSPLETGTIRWATYERVCQFTRSRRLFPGNQGAHYWQDPEEAFAESYAHLSDPHDAVSWQFTPLLQPTRASLAKLQVDLDHPWQGPTTTTVAGSLGAPGAEFSRLIRTPLDGQVSVSVQTPPGADLAVSLHDPDSNRVLAHAGIGEGGSAELSYGNCGRDSLRLVIRNLGAGGTFQATIVKP